MNPHLPPAAGHCRRCLLLGIWLAAMPWLLAAEPPELSGRVSLPNLIRLAAERNPGVQAARARWRAAIEAVPVATGLPDPMLRTDYEQMRGGTREQRLMLSQPFPFPGTLDQAGQVAAAAARMSHADYDMAVRDLIVDLKLSYEELLYLRRAAELTAHNETLLKHLAELTAARYAAGGAKLADLLKAQGQLAQLGYDRLLLVELQEVESARLAALLDLPSGTVFGELEEPPAAWVETSLAALDSAALANRQELAAADAKIAMAGEEIRLARLENRPMFSLDVAVIDNTPGDSSMDSTEDDAWMVGLSVTLPIWQDKNASRVARAKALHEAAVDEGRMLRATTQSELRERYFRLANARRLVELYDRTLIPQARQAMVLAEQQDSLVARDVSGLLETQSTWLNFNLARLRAMADYRQAVARLERLIGGSLPGNPPEATP